MAYEHLTAAEKAHYDEYAKLRSISDWAGFTPQQGQRRDAARAWLEQQRGAIFRSAEGRLAGVASGWDIEDRRRRWVALKPEALVSARPRREVRLPAAGCVPSEVAHIDEREAYLAIDSTTDEQRERRIENLTWLVHRRKQVSGSGSRHGWDVAERRERYIALSIATSYGVAYEEWRKRHDPKTGAPRGRRESTRSRGSRRVRALPSSPSAPTPTTARTGSARHRCAAAVAARASWARRGAGHGSGARLRSPACPTSERVAGWPGSRASRTRHVLARRATEAGATASTRTACNPETPSSSAVTACTWRPCASPWSLRRHQRR